MNSSRGSSFSAWPLRVAVIGAQTAAPESAKPYTVYRTVVTFEGQCYERLLRYSQFLWFYKNLKFQDKSKVKVAFPKKKWSRKGSLEDDVIEERQVKLNEIMKEMGRKELTPQSEQCLMKLLKIGKFDDGTGRVSDFSMMRPLTSYPKSERSGALEAVPEEDESDRNRSKSTNQVEASSTLVVSSLEVPTSNATTVLTDEERSVVGSQPRAVDVGHEDAVMAQAAVTSDARAAAGSKNADSRNSQSGCGCKSTSSITPSQSAGKVLNRPPVQASQSLPAPYHAKQTELAGSVPTRANAPTAVLTTNESSQFGQAIFDRTLSPEKKYRDRISTQLSMISRLLSEAETEDMDSARSIQTQPSLPLTA